MKKYAVKWFSLVLSMAVFIGCAFFLAGKRPVAALEGEDPLLDIAFGDVNITEVKPLDSNDTDSDGTKAKPRTSATEDNGIEVDKEAYLDGDKIHVGYTVTGTNEMLKTDNVFVVENADDNADQLLDAIEKFIKANMEYIDSDSTFKVVVVSKDGDTTDTGDTPLTRDEFLTTYDSSDLSKKPLTDLLTGTTKSSSPLSKDALEDLVEENDTDPSKTDGRKNIIVIAENADKITAKPEKATAIGKIPADYDADDENASTDNDVEIDTFQKLYNTPLTDAPSELSLKDNINSPFSIPGQKASVSFTTDYVSAQPTELPVSGTGLTKDIIANYTLPSLGTYTGTLDYDLEVEGDPKSVALDDNGDIIATFDAELTDGNNNKIVEDIPDTLVEGNVPAMKITKTVASADSKITGGSLLSYTIELENIGNTKLTGVKLSDSLVCSSNVSTNPAPSATTGTGSGTKTYQFKKSGTGDAGELDASDIALEKGDILTATYSFVVPTGAEKSAPYLSDGKYAVKNSAVAEAAELEDKVGDFTETPFEFKEEPLSGGSGNSSGNASGDPGSNGSGGGKKDDTKDKTDSKGDTNNTNNTSPKTGDKPVNVAVVAVMAVAFIASCVSAFLIINERKVRKLVEEAAKVR